MKAADELAQLVASGDTMGNLCQKDETFLNILFTF